jgi:hypothetical protein
VSRAQAARLFGTFKDERLLPLQQAAAAAAVAVPLRSELITKTTTAVRKLADMQRKLRRRVVDI